MGYSPYGCKESDTTEANEHTHTHTHIHTHTHKWGPLGWTSKPLQRANLCSDAKEKLKIGEGRRGLPSPATIPTWVTEALVAGAHAAARAVGAGAERTEVHELRTRRACEARAAAAAEVQPIGVAGPVVLAGCRGAWVHLLLAGGAQVA